MLTFLIVPLSIFFLTLNACAQEKIELYSFEKGGLILADKVYKTEGEWKKILTAEQFSITRKKATERAFSGKYWKTHEKGIYKCACCGNDLFSSVDKYDSATGWPSFRNPVAEQNITTRRDRSFFVARTEVLCARCDAHLGHVFGDGPAPTYKRYCINSVALDFITSE